MCGKFTQMATWRQVHAFSQVLGVSGSDEVKVFTPMRAVPVVHLDDQGDRIVTPMTWGFTNRADQGRRTPKLMHSRGETVHRLPTFAESFRFRRGITFAKTFNEGLEHALNDAQGRPTDKTWTQQWTLENQLGIPAIIGVIYDAFDVGRGAEYEFVQLTVPANEMISTITDRMPLLLSDDDLSLWLGEWRAPIEDVMALIRTAEFDNHWDLNVEDPAKKPPRPRA